MLTALTITQIYVPDQDQALDFYVGKLGFEVTNDMAHPHRPDDGRLSPGLRWWRRAVRRHHPCAVRRAHPCTVIPGSDAPDRVG